MSFVCRTTAVVSVLLTGVFLDLPCHGDEAGGSTSRSGNGLREALLFHASFDNGADADFAKGDIRIHTAESAARKNPKPGLNTDSVILARGKGRSGDALQFLGTSDHVVYFQGDRNVGYHDGNFSGTFSFWLSLDPDQDLKPGYCDPIQITDKKWNDAAIWVDFTKDDSPRHFRLGTFSDFRLWNPDNIAWEDVPNSQRPVVDVASPPFGHGKWTHVAIVFENLNSQTSKSTSKLYLNGELQGAISGIRKLSWDPRKVAIMLGISYIGLFDELVIFNRALTEEEILRLSEGSLVNF